MFPTESSNMGLGCGVTNAIPDKKLKIKSARKHLTRSWKVLKVNANMQSNEVLNFSFDENLK